MDTHHKCIGAMTAKHCFSTRSFRRNITHDTTNWCGQSFLFLSRMLSSLRPAKQQMLNAEGQSSSPQVYYGSRSPLIPLFWCVCFAQKTNLLGPFLAFQDVSGRPQRQAAQGVRASVQALKEGFGPQEATPGFTATRGWWQKFMGRWKRELSLRWETKLRASV